MRRRRAVVRRPSPVAPFPIVRERIAIRVARRRRESHAPIHRRIHIRRAHAHRRLLISRKGTAIHRHVDPRHPARRPAQDRRDVNARRRIRKGAPDQHRAVILAARRGRVVEQHRLPIVNGHVAPVQQHAVEHVSVAARIILPVFDPVIAARPRAIHRQRALPGRGLPVKRREARRRRPVRGDFQNVRVRQPVEIVLLPRPKVRIRRAARAAMWSNGFPYSTALPAPIVVPSVVSQKPA